MVIKGFIYFFFVMALCAIVAMRGDTEDTSGYIEIYYDSVNYDVSYILSRYNIEPSFYYISKITSAFIYRHEAFFFLYSLLAFVFIYLASKLLNASFGYVLIFYVLNYFIAYQFTLMRQGLGLAFIYFIIALIYQLRSIKWISLVFLIGLVVGVSIHVVSVLPLVILGLLRVVLFHPFFLRRDNYYLICFVLLFGSFLVCFFLIKNLQVFFEFVNSDKLNYYSESEEYSAALSFFSIANIKALVGLMLSFYLCRSSFVRREVKYLMIAAYSVQVGMRFGLIDFAIFSGRVGAAFSFYDAFLFSIFFHCLRVNIYLKLAIFLFVSVLSGVWLLFFQYPNIVVDYIRSHGF